MGDLGYLDPDTSVAAAVGVLAPALARAKPEVRRNVRVGLWKRYGQVVVMHNGPLTPEQAVWVAVLRSPRGVVLSGLTAAIRRGLRVEAPERPELLVPAAGPLPHLQGVDVSRTRLLTAVDVHPTAQPPQLRLPRALIDRASRLARPDDIRALLCAGVQQRRLRAQDLREVVLRLGPVRHRALLLRTIEDIEAGAHSVRELQFLRLLRAERLPLPEQQVVRQRPGGRHYLDVRWRRYALHVEIDGVGHLLVSTWARELDRGHELTLSGRADTQLRIAGFWLDERPNHVAEQIRRGLRKGGWSDQVAINAAA
jgi:very-short-patch-repair endonuclease